MEQRLFRRTVAKQINKKPPRITVKEFEKYTDLLLTNVELIPAPAGSSLIEQLKSHLEEYYDLPIKRKCMHEVVFSASNFKKLNGIRALDIAKRLIDYGIHPPTMYFPLIIDEALMIEPTETESKETLDYFISSMIKISEEAKNDPEILRNAPHNTPNSRLDEALAARKPNLRWQKESN